MTGLGKSPKRWRFIALLACWTFVLVTGIAQIMMHHDRMNGFSGFVIWLGVLTAPVIIVSEIYRMRSR